MFYKKSAEDIVIEGGGRNNPEEGLNLLIRRIQKSLKSVVYQINNTYICINKTPKSAQNTQNRGFQNTKNMKVQRISEINSQFSLFPAQYF